MPPIPKPKDQLADQRPSRTEGLTQLEVTNPTYDAPPANPDWHWIAADWYSALVDSAQSHFYQPSDWATAVILAESLSKEFKRADDPESKKGLSPMMLQVFMAEAGNLLTTEGQRRRLRLELIKAEKSNDDSAEVLSIMDGYKSQLAR